MNRSDYRLVPLSTADLPVVLAWRNSARVRAGMYNDDIVAADEHQRWYERGLGDPAVARFVFYAAQLPAGFVNIYDVDQRNRRCLLGYYVGIESAPKGTGSALMFLALEEIFERLGLRKVTCEIIGGNAASLRLVRRFGFAPEGRFVEHYRRGEHYLDVEAHALFVDDWRTRKDNLAAITFE